MSSSTASPARRVPHASVALLAAAAFGCAAVGWAIEPAPLPPSAGAAAPTAEEIKANRWETAIFAGGCFWCMEKPFDSLDGVISTTSGYTAGDVEDPTYYQVSAGRTGHTEALKIVYDPKKLKYDTLLRMFWLNIDPFQKNGQFVDRGTQYRTAICYNSPEQKQAAEASSKAVQKRFDRHVFTEILPASAFYEAEDYHQDFYIKSPGRYNSYAANCGRIPRLNEIWGAEAGGALLLKEHGKKAAAEKQTAE
ncbi:peptide-methionine (S)-S-oxide reductase MsrA [Alienimonas chondri]|uniref:Peptide methionine sulfoxide reductase MsrA n=1 Tax=Alienimonas chondri TaxID=2681879 RepID=A0ABX1VJI6_9PLAN|nr:Peptide methionine sulfoxide reductase MsrA [Alienimonas chondri]